MEARQYGRDFIPNPLLSKYTIKRLVSPNNEAADLDASQYAAAFQATKAAALEKHPEKPAPTYALGPHIRMQRSPRQGLLLLYPLNPKHLNKETPIFVPVGLEAIMGFAVSFPSETAYKGDGLDYMVNYVYTALADFDLE